MTIIRKAGSEIFYIHARKAILSKLSPKQNLNIPPLNYNFVYNIKKDFNVNTVILNGGIDSIDKVKTHLKKVDGVMIGRSVYHSPYILTDIEREIFDNDEISSRQEIIEKLIPYVKSEVKKGVRLNQIMRHTIGLFHGQTGSNFWKKYLSKNMCVRDADVKKIDHIMDKIKVDRIDNLAGQID